MDIEELKVCMKKTKPDMSHDNSNESILRSFLGAKCFRDKKEENENQCTVDKRRSSSYIFVPAQHLSAVPANVYILKILLIG
jgi:hypothetical protein